MSWSGEREGWVRCAHLAKSEALVILAESSKEDLEKGRKLAAPACPVASQPVNYVGENEKVRNPSTEEKPALPIFKKGCKGTGSAECVVNLWEKEVWVDGNKYPPLKDWNYLDFCAKPSEKRCGVLFAKLARVYMAVRVKHDMNSWGDEPENCRLEFNKLYKLSEHSDVKADLAKVRGARGPHYVYKAESLAVERSG